MKYYVAYIHIYPHQPQGDWKGNYVLVVGQHMLGPTRPARPTTFVSTNAADLAVHQNALAEGQDEQQQPRWLQERGRLSACARQQLQ